MTSWQLEARLEPCRRAYVWTNVSNSSGARPPARAGALGVSIGEQLFVHGGRSKDDPWPETRLWRYDLPRNHWHELNPAPEADGAYAPSGKAAAITPWGVYAFGGLGFYWNERGIHESKFDDRVLWLDMPNRRWWADEYVTPVRHHGPVEPPMEGREGKLEVDEIAARVLKGQDAPRGRYYASLAFLEGGIADALAAEAAVQAGDASSRNARPPAVLLFGGDDDRTDLDDAWLLKLANASLREPEGEGSRYEFHLSPSNHLAFCGWRFRATAQRLWDESCGANTTSRSDPEECSLQHIVQRAYCMHQYQSLNHYPG